AFSRGGIGMPTLRPLLYLALCFSASIAAAKDEKRTAAPSRQTSEQAVITFGMTAEPSRRMHGKGIPWEHEVRVALPPSYGKSNESYPVLWALDGALDMAVNTIQEAGKSIPEMIVVSVGPLPEARAEFQFQRDWDFSPLPGKRYTD